jgi:hypothetical protein
VGSESESIWKGKEPKPVDTVESCEPIDMPNVRLVEGGTNGSEGGGGRCGGWVGGFCVVFILDAGWFGERGGDRAGLSEIGDGGTKGKDSRIESAVFDIADEPDTRLFFSPPCACARACAWASARCCCCSNVPKFSAEGGVTNRPIVVR